MTLNTIIMLIIQKINSWYIVPTDPDIQPSPSADLCHHSPVLPSRRTPRSKPPPLLPLQLQQLPHWSPCSRSWPLRFVLHVEPEIHITVDPAPHFFTFSEICLQIPQVKTWGYTWTRQARLGCVLSVLRLCVKDWVHAQDTRRYHSLKLYHY